MNDGSSSALSKQSFLNKITQFFLPEPRDRAHLLDTVQQAAQRGIIDAEALSIVQGALQVSDMQVREIMIPCSQAAMLQERGSLQDMLRIITESAHSRFPVLSKDDPDEVVGIILAKDLLTLVAENRLEQLELEEIIRPAVFVPESKRLNVLLKEFQASRNHMAIVINEYGGLAGLVTIEDILEQIVGEIEDEHDFEEEFFIKKTGKNQFVVKAVTPIEEFNDHFNMQFRDDEFDTIGGVVTHHFGHLPSRDESIKIEGIKFKVLNADHRSIRLLEVVPKKIAKATA